MEIGSLVAPKDDRDVLCSGCGVYDRAVVVSVKPFALISEGGDMWWSATVKADAFRVVGRASAKAAANVLDRLARDPASKAIPEANVESLRRLAAGAQPAAA